MHYSKTLLEDFGTFVRNTHQLGYWVHAETGATINPYSIPSVHLRHTLDDVEPIHP